jgi:iron(III) transport system permease protein
VTLAAVLVLVVAVVAPIVSMVATSFRVHEMVLVNGTVLRVAGSVTEEALDPAKPDGPALLRFNAPSESDPDADTTAVALASSAFVAREGRFVWSLANYRDVFASRRVRGLLVNSLELATGSALLALLLGLPVGWIIARSDLRGRAFAAVLLAGPLLLPPFFAAMGTSSGVGKVTEWLGLSGGTLQLANSMICFASLLFPIPAALVGRALAAVPAGTAEAARLLGGEAAVRRHVVLPAVLPAVLASFGLVVVMSLCDFAVPDLLGVFLPNGSVPIHVFATEIFFQWSKSGGNVGRSVATSAPFVLFVVVLLVLVARALRRCPEGTISGAFRPRPPVRLSGRGRVLSVAMLVLAFGLGLGLPIGAVCSWGFTPSRIPATIRETPALIPDALRWLRLGLLSAALVTATAVVLARAVLRSPRAVGRGLVPASLATLAVPGMALMVATLLLWRAIPAAPGTLWKGVLILTARFLPYAFAAAWLALRAVDRGLEDAARTLGAPPAVRAWRIWLPLSGRGLTGAFVLALVLALRELDSLVLVESGILPVRIYDNVHYGRTGHVADLSMAYLGVLLIPALVAVALLRRRTGPGGGGGAGGRPEGTPSLARS